MRKVTDQQIRELLRDWYSAELALINETGWGKERIAAIRQLNSKMRERCNQFQVTSGDCGILYEQER